MRRTISQKFWEDKYGNTVVWQNPNIFLWIWIITVVAGWFLPYIEWLRTAVGTISLISLVIWAGLELFKGVNYFRRTIGFLVLLLLVLVRVM